MFFNTPLVATLLRLVSGHSRAPQTSDRHFGHTIKSVVVF